MTFTTKTYQGNKFAYFTSELGVNYCASLHQQGVHFTGADHWSEYGTGEDEIIDAQGTRLIDLAPEIIKILS